MPNAQIAFSKTATHSDLFFAGVAVYESGELYQQACTLAMELIDEARECLTPSEFTTWWKGEFGTGGSKGDDGYMVGKLATEWRNKGYLNQRSRKKEDGRDPAANRLNTWLSALRAILRKMSDVASFTWLDSFDATKRAAQAKGESNRNGTGKKGKGKGKPGTAVVVSAELHRAWIEANPVDAADVLIGLMVKEKLSISIRAQKAARDSLATRWAEKAQVNEAKNKTANKAAVEQDEQDDGEDVVDAMNKALARIKGKKSA